MGYFTSCGYRETLQITIPEAIARRSFQEEETEADQEEEKEGEDTPVFPRKFGPFLLRVVQIRFQSNRIQFEPNRNSIRIRRIRF